MSASNPSARLKIAVWHNLPSGGGKRALHGQIVGLQSRGHHIEAWCPETADPDYLPLIEIIREHRLPLALPAVASRLRRGFDKVQGHDRLLDAVDTHSRRCAAEIVAGKFDVVLLAPCVFYRVPRLGRFLPGPDEGAPPRVLYLQEPNRVFYEALPELPWLAPMDLPPGVFSGRGVFKRLSDFFNVRNLRRAGRRELEDACSYDLILVNSFFSRESVARAYGLNARVCYLGYETARFQPSDLPREDFLLGLGSMDYIKGVDTAIRAVAALPESHRLPLVWVANSGNDTYEAQNRALATTLGVRLDVRHRIGDDALTGLLQRTRLLLYTSRLEPFGYAPVEAAACGTPVVAVAEGGVRETVVDGVTGLLCDRDPDALAAAMTRVLADESFAAELGVQGARLARERWALEPSILRLEAHLSAALAQIKRVG